MSEGVFYIGGSRFVCQIIEPVTRLANLPGIVPEIVLLSRRPGNLPNIPGSLANWLRFQAPVSVYDIHTRNSIGRAKAATRNTTVLGERRQPLETLQYWVSEGSH